MKLFAEIVLFILYFLAVIFIIYLVLFVLVPAFVLTAK